MSSLEAIPHNFRRGAMLCASLIQDMDYVLLAAHVNLDGDALGSLCGMGYILKTLNKQFAIYSPQGIPHRLRFLQLPGKIYTDIGRLPFYPRSAIYLDCSESKRLGEPLSSRIDSWPSLNIDHHICEKGLGSLGNYIMPSAAATTQLVAYVALALNLDINNGLAEGITVGLITDTGSFSHDNTTADVFSLCALLSQNGCDIAEIQDQLQKNWSLGKIHLWGELLSRVELYNDRRIAMCQATLNDFTHYHCSLEDIEGVVEWLRRIRGVEVAAFLREETHDLCKFSLRSHGDLDVRSIAADLGGGGHFNASGGLMHLPLAEGKKLLLHTIENHLSRSN